MKTNAVSISPLPCKDLLSVAELDLSAVDALFRTASAVKRDVGAYAGALAGKSVILIFEKPSLRTRVSFEAGVARLGGHPIYYDHSTSKLGERESVHDYARNLERMVDLIVCRTHAHGPLAELAGFAKIGVVNALCEKYHPCQALADLFTMRERFGEVAGRRLAFVGDGNNVCHSLILLATTLGMRVTVVGPKGYEPDADVMELAAARAKKCGGSFAITTSMGGVKGADVVYTDTWVSMGDEPEQIRRREAFQRYQVNGEVMARAAKGAIFMHCLPANRGMEVTDEVMDSPASVVFDQAENRMHAQNALMLHMLVPGVAPGGRATRQFDAAARDRRDSGGIPSPVVRATRRRTTAPAAP